MVCLVMLAFRAFSTTVGRGFRCAVGASMRSLCLDVYVGVVGVRGWAGRERSSAVRTVFSSESLGCDLSHLRESAVLAGQRSSRCAAGECAALA